jgi:hypothetical protein
MLDPARRLVLPEWPWLAIYRDHQRPDSYYVLPPAPALRTDGQKRPEGRLLVYLTGQGPERRASGGQLSLTTTLAVGAPELARLKEDLQRWLEDVPDVPPGGGLHLSGPEWESGAVEVDLTPTLSLRGQPSLTGDNACVLFGRLDGAQVADLRAHWARRLPAGRIRYRMVMRVAATTTATLRAAERSAARGPVGRSDRLQHIGFDLHAVQGTGHPVTVEGPLWSEAMSGLLTEVDL